ncbi:MAG TPA: hypothetical protein VFS67_04890, partial [Polyangiaceae bacterium]|nr:hypothetical protein [Polyangiaceae bacterium]
MRARRPGSFRDTASFLLCALPGAVAIACSSSGEGHRSELPPPFPATGSSVLPNAPSGSAAGAGGRGNGGSASGEAAGPGAPLAGGSGAASRGSIGAPAVAAGGSGSVAAGGYDPAEPLSALCPAGTAFCEDFEDDA